MIIKAPSVVNIIEEKFTIDGKAAYGNGVMVPDAEVMLLDTLEKTLLTTRTTTKLFGRFFVIINPLFLKNINYILNSLEIKKRGPMIIIPDS